MSVIKSGDLVMLKSGGPPMTVDTVNTDIFDDSKITGVLCVWFVGEKLERVRFDPKAIEPVATQKKRSARPEASSPRESGEYNVVLDEMVAAMNVAGDAQKVGLKKAGRRSKPAAAAKYDAPAEDGVGAT